jgi:multidrug efflux pump subunit AcrA (membrane-fusion protein)
VFSRRSTELLGDIPVHVGDRVTNTTVLTTIDERRGLEVYLPIPSDRAKELKIAAPVQILDAAGDVILTTRVYFISPQVDTSTQSVLAKAPVDQAADRLRSQQLVRARITWGTQPGITIPVVAVSRISGQFFAFIAQQKTGRKSHARFRSPWVTFQATSGTTSLSPGARTWWTACQSRFSSSTRPPRGRNTRIVR